MLKNLEAKPARDIHGAVGTVIVHENADIHEIRHFAHRDFKGLFCVISGHYDRNVFAVDHAGETV
jgi:hypothetical protein